MFNYKLIFFKGYWLAYKDGVYDISSFVENHPGGKQILKTAGKALEGCWKIFTIHQIDHVYEVLEEYRIGNLPPGIIKKKKIILFEKNSLSR
jgi:sulfite oxidase